MGCEGVLRGEGCVRGCGEGVLRGCFERVDESAWDEKVC